MLSRNPLPRAASIRPQNLGQTALTMAGNACLIVFVFLILILTIISSRLQSSDPILHPSNLNHVGPLPITSAITLTDLDLDDGWSENPNSECDTDKPIDCTDQEVFHVMMEAAIEKFKDIHFNRFGKAVRGTNHSTCHMAWRFRPKIGKTTGFNKDYRTFVISRSRNCTLTVVSIGEYHSGEHARKIKKKPHEKAASEEGESLPIFQPDALFRKKRYLVYFGGGDRCKDMDHYLKSLTCALGEAQYLNRTLVIDLSMCVSSLYTSMELDEEGKDFRFYFDFQHLKDSASVLDQTQFWLNWNQFHDKYGLNIRVVEDFRITPMKLKRFKGALIMRKFGIVEPYNYWYRVCEGEAGSVIHRPLDAVKKSKRLMEIASEIASRLNGDYDSVSIWQGGEILKSDISPEYLLLTLQEKVESGRKLYVATDVLEKSFFDSLKGKYSVHLLDEYEDLWDETSVWYSEITKLNNGVPVEFDGYMRRSVDFEVFLRGKRQIEL